MIDGAGMAALSRQTAHGLAGILLAAALVCGLWLLLRYGSRHWPLSQGLRKALDSVAEKSLIAAATLSIALLTGIAGSTAIIGDAFPTHVLDGAVVAIGKFREFTDSSKWIPFAWLIALLGSVAADLCGAGRFAVPVLAADTWFGRVGTVAMVLSFVAWGFGIEGAITDAASAHLARVTDLDKRASKALAEQWSRDVAKELVSRTLAALPPSYAEAKRAVETLPTWKQRAHDLQQCCKTFDAATLASFDSVKASSRAVPDFISHDDRSAELIPRSPDLGYARRLLAALDASGSSSVPTGEKDEHRDSMVESVVAIILNPSTWPKIHAFYASDPYLGPLFDVVSDTVAATLSHGYLGKFLASFHQFPEETGEALGDRIKAAAQADAGAVTIAPSQQQLGNARLAVRSAGEALKLEAAVRAQWEDLKAQNRRDGQSLVVHLDRLAANAFDPAGRARQIRAALGGLSDSDDAINIRDALSNLARILAILQHSATTALERGVALEAFFSAVETTAAGDYGRTAHDLQIIERLPPATIKSRFTRLSQDVFWPRFPRDPVWENRYEEAMHPR